MRKEEEELVRKMKKINKRKRLVGECWSCLPNSQVAAFPNGINTFLY